MQTQEPSYQSGRGQAAAAAGSDPGSTSKEPSAERSAEVGPVLEVAEEEAAEPASWLVAAAASAVVKIVPA